MQCTVTGARHPYHHTLKQTPTAFPLTSPDIADHSAIATPYVFPACGGKNLSPQLHWSGAPAGSAMIGFNIHANMLAQSSFTGTFSVGAGPAK